MNHCPSCGQSTGQVKAGLNASGSQRTKCMHCGRKYTSSPNMRRYPEAIRSEAVRLYLSGMSFRAVSMKIAVNHQSVINWVNEYGKHLPRPVGRSLTRR